MIFSRNRLKRVGESRHPCRTPAVVRNQSPMLPLKRTALVCGLVIEVFDDLDKACADVVLLYGCHGQHRKSRERFLKNAGEWTGRVEISKEEIPGSKRSKYHV